MLDALIREIRLRKDYPGGEALDTVYFGGGTPSLPEAAWIARLMETIRENFSIRPEAEVTLEANPDDVTEEKIPHWKSAGINRLSIGVQSFFTEDLQWMNRSHDAEQAVQSIRLAQQHFANLNVDLIYGFPLLSDDKWKQNVERVVSWNIPHLSCYALTVEPRTALQKMLREPLDGGKQADQFLLLMGWLRDAGYEHYEISNFAKPGHRSRHNTSYWLGKKYLGIGPSAHSFDLESRQWNVSNNAQYRESLARGVVPFEKEALSPLQKQNEYIMTSLRTIEGLDLSRFSETEQSRLLAAARTFLDAGRMLHSGERLQLTDEGKLFADGIAAELFFSQ